MKKLSKLALLALSALSLSACVSTEISSVNQAHYDSSSQARIRLYGQNGKPTTLKIVVNGNTVDKISVGGGMGQAFSSMVGAKGDEPLGIKSTYYSQNKDKLSGGFLSSIFYKEFIIPTKDTVIEVKSNIIPTQNVMEDIYSGYTLITSTKSCRGNVVSFEPQAGHDYEVVPVTRSGCDLTLIELN